MELDLKDYDQIRIGWFDSCRTAGYEDGKILRCSEDLAHTLGFFSAMAQGNQCSIFFGWRIDPKNYPNLYDSFSLANSGQMIIWGERTGLGSGRTLQQSLDAEYGNIHIRHILWGKNKERGDDDDNLYMYGSGNLSNMKLKW